MLRVCRGHLMRVWGIKGEILGGAVRTRVAILLIQAI